MATIGELIVQLGVDASALHSGLDDAGKRFQKFGSELSQAGRNLSLTVTAPILAVGVGAIKAASDWETSMTMVAKTVDVPAAEIARLGREFMALSEAIPVSANELARIGSLAGQLGIETENILGFTRVMADLGVTTNLTADQAADSLARLANITGMAETDFDRLGSTIVDLGNKGASTEAEIVDFSLRIAGAGTIAGLAESEILAIGAAMSSVGVEAEAGGTSVQKVLLAMTESAATGNEHLQVFARTAGVSATEFARLFREDAAGAFALFVTGLGKQGQDAFGTLEQLDLQDQRLIRSFLSLAGAGDLLNEQLAIGTQAWAENTALTAEAEKFYATLGNQFAILKNQVMNTAAELGTALRPALDKILDVARPILDWIGDVVEGFKKLDPNLQAVIIAAFGLAAAIGPVLAFGGLLITAVGSIISVLSAVGAPVLAVVAALGVLVAGLVAAYTKSETFREIVNGVFRAVMETVKPILEELAETVRVVLENMRAWWAEHGETVMSIVTPAMQAISAFIEGVMKYIGEAIKFVLNIIQGDWQGALGNLEAASEISKQALAAIFDALKTLLINIVKAMWGEIKQQFVDAINDIKGAVGAFADEIKGQFERLADVLTFGSIWPEMWESIAGQTEEWCGTIRGITEDWQGALFDLFDDLSGGLISKVTNMWKTITNIFDDVTSIIGKIGDALGFSTSAAAEISAAATSAATAAGTLAGTTVAAGGVVGVSGTAGGLVTGAGIPTIGTSGAAAGGGAAGGGFGAIAGGAAGAGIALLGPLAISFLGEGLMDLFGANDLQEDFNRTTRWMDRMTQQQADWEDMLAGEHILSGGGTFNPDSYVIEMDGQRVGRLVMKHGVDALRTQTGLEAV